MRLNEIKPGTGVQLLVTIGQQTLEFYSNAQEVYDDCIYIDPIMQDDKLVGFSTKGLMLDLIVTDAETERAYKFSNVKVRTIKTPKEEKIYHEVRCNTDGKAINRRGACRVWLGEEGMASYGLGNPSFPITVKDISVSGIAFICSRDQDIPEGSIVHINFVDETTNTTFSLAAIIVRSMDMEKSRIMYGCKLNQESNTIAKFVNDKQREKLKANRQSNLNAFVQEANKLKNK